MFSLGFFSWISNTLFVKNQSRMKDALWNVPTPHASLNSVRNLLSFVYSPPASWFGHIARKQKVTSYILSTFHLYCILEGSYAHHCILELLHISVHRELNLLTEGYIVMLLTMFSLTSSWLVNNWVISNSLILLRFFQNIY